MAVDNKITVRVTDTHDGNIDAIADATGLRRPEVIRRLLTLGCEDVEALGVDAILHADDPVEIETEQ
ncbi:hypothetical protein [Halocalculus aciditolerans]|uniref:Uncharacterized protein n=1 Tax=Halocalculus aciditolerans TaxID=1383812 RepID=A0A830FKG1_9EURY|nr:hypothetical protein [Halocalculus aciditolerans]GGL55333.1 hypothetical protein GCM10009039_11830 [Halocalculus aciditolerans]